MDIIITILACLAMGYLGWLSGKYTTGFTGLMFATAGYLIGVFYAMFVILN